MTGHGGPSPPPAGRRAVPSAATIADEIAVEMLLRCWMREVGPPPPPGARSVRIPLTASGVELEVPVTYRSPSGWHRFGRPRLLAGSADPRSTVDTGLLGALLIREVVRRAGLPAGAGSDALARILDSTGRIATYIAANRTAQATRTSRAVPTSQGAPSGVPPFLAAERMLVTGHPFHPAAKSRQGGSDAELARYSPELGGEFRLHWFAAHPSVVTVGGSLASRHLPGAELAPSTGYPGGGLATGTGGVGVGRQNDPRTLLTALCGDAEIPAGYIPVPAHPWQAREMVGEHGGLNGLGRLSGLGELLADGRLVDLGPLGPPWYPTASLRTVWHPDSPVMFKLSLGMRITNSRRHLQRSELRLGAEMARFVDRSVHGWLRARHPRFRLIPEPAWLTVDGPIAPGSASWAGGAGETGGTGRTGRSGELAGNPAEPDAVGGLGASIRLNPIGRDDPVVCAAALVADRPDLASAAPERSRCSLLARTVRRLARQVGRDAGDVAADWFERYLRVLADPLLDLYLCHGVGLEAHLQNTLVTLDSAGWPIAGWYRDSQGYYLAASRSASRADRGLEPPADVPAVFADALIEDRIIYYTIVNNLLAVAGALGSAGIADEARLLGQVRGLVLRLRREIDSGQDGHGPASGDAGPAGDLLGRLLDAPALPCKGNLLTCVDGRDELVGPVETQSIYMEIPNPLLEVRP